MIAAAPSIQKIAPFGVHAWQVGPWRDTSPVLILDGAAGGGKSRLAAEKIHGCALRYPGSTSLILRKTRESMKNSTVLFFEHTVVGGDRRVRHIRSERRFEYSNGSIVAYGGMADENQREQIRSIGLDGGLDFAWLEEAKSFKEADYNEVLGRMRGRRAGWRQIILTTNPDSPQHWIWKRLIMGKEATRYPSMTTDNPLNDAAYLDSLNRLTGVQRQRLLEGLWVRAEGAVFDNWSEDNVDGDRAVYDPERRLIWAVDDGYHNPRVILIAQTRPDGTWVILAEYYEREAMPDTSIAAALALSPKRPAVAVYDPSAATFAASLNRHGIQTASADNTVSEGIKTVRQYIRDGNERISLYVHPSCTHLIDEVANYQWSDSSGIQGGDPKPVKENDHAVDALRYLLHTSTPYRIPIGGF